MAIFLTILFAILVSIRWSLADENCPEKKCAQISLNDEGAVVLTVFFDNDAVNSPKKINEPMLLNICGVLANFKKTGESNVLEVDFKMGASSWYNPIEKIVYCNNCMADMLEACAAKYVANFPDYFCCKHDPESKKSSSECANEQGPDIGKKIDQCLSTEEGQRIILGNSNKRFEAQVPICWLPHVLYNGVTDGCSSFESADELMKIICAMYKNADVFITACPHTPEEIEKEKKKKEKEAEEQAQAELEAELAAQEAVDNGYYDYDYDDDYY